MLHRRIGYGAALAAAVLFQIFFVGYLSTYVLILVLVLPLLSLALSLPSMRRCGLALSAGPGGLRRGEEGALTLALEGKFSLPLARVTLRIALTNQLTGQTRRVRRTLAGPQRGAALREELDTAHCGRLACAIKRPRAADLLGLFTLPLACPEPCALLVLPRGEDLDLPPELSGGREEGASLRPRPGGGPGEDYDLRAYRPGDPLRSIHWKLSSKLDDLIVRETLEPHRPALALTYDHFGPPDALDRVFDRLYALSLALIARGRPHQIRWADPVTGALRGGLVAGEQDLFARLEECFSTPAPAAGRSVLDLPLSAPEGGPMRRIHLSGPEEGGAP